MKCNLYKNVAKAMISLLYYLSFLVFYMIKENSKQNIDIVYPYFWTTAFLFWIYIALNIALKNWLLRLALTPMVLLLCAYVISFFFGVIMKIILPVLFSFKFECRVFMGELDVFIALGALVFPLVLFLISDILAAVIDTKTSTNS